MTCEKCQYCGKKIFKCFLNGKVEIAEGFIEDSSVYAGRVILHSCKMEDMK